jgi:hypothetical protein
MRAGSNPSTIKEAGGGERRKDPLFPARKAPEQPCGVLLCLLILWPSVQVGIMVSDSHVTTNSLMASLAA